MTMKRDSLKSLALGFLVLTACSQSSLTNAGALRNGEIAAFARDWGGKDAGRIAAHFTDDGTVMVPNSPTIAGKNAIAAAMEEALADPNWSLALQPVQVEVSASG